MGNLPYYCGLGEGEGEGGGQGGQWENLFGEEKAGSMHMAWGRERRGISPCLEGGRISSMACSAHPASLPQEFTLHTCTHCIFLFKNACLEGEWHVLCWNSCLPHPLLPQLHPYHHFPAHLLSEAKSLKPNFLPPRNKHFCSSFISSRADGTCLLFSLHLCFGGGI